MGVTAMVKTFGQLAAGIWTDLTTDTVQEQGLHVKYGIADNGPKDCVAGTGEASVTLRNDAGNSVSQQGAYSPNHASKRAGWTFGIPFAVAISHGSDAAVAVSTLTRSGSTATVTTAAAHGLSTDDWVIIAGAGQAEYNGIFQITVTGGSTFTYAVSGTPATPATGTITARKTYVKHRGKVQVIDPEAGQYLSQRAKIVSYDIMHDLAEADAREVTLQIDQGEDDLITALLDAVPSSAQPVARDLDAGVDTFPYAFDDLGGTVKALTAIQDVAIGAFALVALKGDGTFMLRSRSTRATGASVYTFNNTMHGLAVPSTQAKVWNLVRVTIRPKVVSAAATDELYTLPTGASIAIPQGETRETWTDYTDPNDRNVHIGGTSVVTALVGGTHYSANAAADGSGADLTASIAATITPFGSTAKWTLQNTNTTQTAYITLLKAIGKAVRNPGPQTYQSYTAKDYGVRPLDIELRYQSDADLARSYAIFVEQQYNELAPQINAITFLANDSSDFMTQALAREPGDIITITEAVTGLASVDAVIHSVELDVMPGPWIVCRWGLAPAAPFKSWVLGIAGRSELGETTRLGF